MKGEKQDKKGWYKWIFHRFNLGPIEKNIVYHRVEKGPWYYGAGATLLLLMIVLFSTGAFMALGYAPDSNSAYESVNQITKHTLLGSFVRGLHYWSAGIMVVMILYHMFRQILLGGYLPPREGIWLIGVILFFLVITTSFIGYVLRWDQRGIYALSVALNIFYKVPLIGEDIVRFVQGGDLIGSHSLRRLYAVHTLFIPFSLLGFLAYHMYLVIEYGSTTPLEQKVAPETAEEQIALRKIEKESASHGQDFFPYTVAKSGSVAFVVFLVVVALAILVGPSELYPPANLSVDAYPKEEWWFAWYSALSAILPPALAEIFHWTFPLLIFLLLILLPFVDKGNNRGLFRRPLAVITITLLVILLLGLSGLRSRSPWAAWPPNSLPPLPPGQELPKEAEKGRELFATYGCYNCHAVGGEGSEFGPNLSALNSRLSLQELEQYIRQPPDNVAMPSYESRLSEDELNSIAHYVLAIQTFKREF